MRDKPSLKPPPRKNLRGFLRHMRALVDRLVREEFPELEQVSVIFGNLSTGEGVLAHWHEEKDAENFVFRHIFLNIYDAKGRQFYLTADDGKIRDLLRHELLHGEMTRRGQPSGDDDLPFIMECLRLRTHVNDASIPFVEAAYGRGTFYAFQATLPPPETEPILLPENAGVLLRKTGR